MNRKIDQGVRCDSHMGEAWPPRCSICEQLSNDWRALTQSYNDPRVRLDPNSECDKHPGYPLPCFACKRIEALA